MAKAEQDTAVHYKQDPSSPSRDVRSSQSKVDPQGET